MAPVALGAALDFEAARIGVQGGSQVVEVTVSADGEPVARGEALVAAPRGALVFTGQGVQRRGLGCGRARALGRGARRVGARRRAHARGPRVLAARRRRAQPAELRLAGGEMLRHPDGVLHRTELTQPALLTLAAAQLAELREAGMLADEGLRRRPQRRRVRRAVCARGARARGGRRARAPARASSSSAACRATSAAHRPTGWPSSTRRGLGGELPAVEGVEVVNENALGRQLGVAGPRAALERLAALLPPGAVRMLPRIDVPFHSSLLDARRRGPACRARAPGRPGRPPQPRRPLGAEPPRATVLAVGRVRARRRLRAGRRGARCAGPAARRRAACPAGRRRRCAGSTPSACCVAPRRRGRLRRAAHRRDRTGRRAGADRAHANDARVARPRRPGARAAARRGRSRRGPAHRPAGRAAGGSRRRLAALAPGTPAISWRRRPNRPRRRRPACSRRPDRPRRGDRRGGAGRTGRRGDAGRTGRAGGDRTSGRPTDRRRHRVAARPRGPGARCGRSSSTTPRHSTSSSRARRRGATRCCWTSAASSGCRAPTRPRASRSASSSARCASRGHATAIRASTCATPSAAGLSRALGRSGMTRGRGRRAAQPSRAGSARGSSTTCSRCSRWRRGRARRLAGVRSGGSRIPARRRPRRPAGLVDRAADLCGEALGIALPARAPVRPDPAAPAPRRSPGASRRRSRRPLARCSTASGAAADAPAQPPASVADRDRLAILDAELGPARAAEIAPRFDHRRHVRFASAWASARWDLVAAYHEGLRGRIDRDALRRIAAHTVEPPVLATALFLAAKAAGHGAAELASALEHVAVGRSAPAAPAGVRPVVEIAPDGTLVASTEPAPERPLDLVAARGPTVPGELADALRASLETTPDLRSETALVTGASPGSIAAELVRWLLGGGARVVITTSTDTPERRRWYRELYRTSAGPGAELHVLPANLASFADVDALVAWLAQPETSTSGRADLRIDPLRPTIVAPFAALPTAGELGDAGAGSEVVLRLQLLGVQRLVAAIAAGVPDGAPSPTVLLALSPNHGGFGGDGAYGETKAGARGPPRPLAQRARVVGIARADRRAADRLGARNRAHGPGRRGRRARRVRLGVRTFSAQEMGWMLSVLACSPAVRERASQAPFELDLSGGLSRTSTTSTRAVEPLAAELRERGGATRAAGMSSTKRSPDRASTPPPCRTARLRDGRRHARSEAARGSGARLRAAGRRGACRGGAARGSARARAAEPAHDPADLVVIVGAAELGPCGTAATPLRHRARRRAVARRPSASWRGSAGSSPSSATATADAGSTPRRGRRSPRSSSPSATRAPSRRASASGRSRTTRDVGAAGCPCSRPSRCPRSCASRSQDEARARTFEAAGARAAPRDRARRGRSSCARDADPRAAHRRAPPPRRGPAAGRARPRALRDPRRPARQRRSHGARQPRLHDRGVRGRRHSRPRSCSARSIPRSSRARRAAGWAAWRRCDGCCSTRCSTTSASPSACRSRSATSSRRTRCSRSSARTGRWCIRSRRARPPRSRSRRRTTRSAPARRSPSSPAASTT